MSFGFGVGDFLAVAKLAIQLSEALSDSAGAAQQYQELIAILNVVHKVLLQVDQLRGANQLAQATVNALLFTVNSTNMTMETFLDQYAAYSKSLRPGGSGNRVSDMVQKGKWAIQMPDKASPLMIVPEFEVSKLMTMWISGLQKTLGTMLAAINCLVSLACYQNTAYDARCGANLHPSILSVSRLPNIDCPWRDIKATARLARGIRNRSLCPGFEVQSDPESMFRPGQIFAAQIDSNFVLYNHRTFRDIDFGNLPLEPIPTLKATAENEKLEDRAKRLAQVRQLPLEKMTRYCKDVAGNRKKVDCLLCSNPEKQSIYPKDNWATWHFRIVHWNKYFGMVPVSEATERRLSTKKPTKIISWEKQSEELPQPPDPNFSADKWIVFEDVELDTPIHSEDEIIGRILCFSSRHHHLAGPIMIQRLVVVREGRNECLCLGIHTYARHGCGHQPDQELHGELCLTETPPPRQPDETGIVLAPVRMEPDHPSLALPSTTRIHYGRSYEIGHSLPVQPLGLVHPASMETLLDQFDQNVDRFTSEEQASGKRHRTREEDQDPRTQVEAAEMSIASDIRESITKVLGPELTPAVHRPPEGTEEQFYPRLRRPRG